MLYSVVSRCKSPTRTTPSTFLDSRESVTTFKRPLLFPHDLTFATYLETDSTMTSTYRLFISERHMALVKQRACDGYQGRWTTRH